MSALYSEPTGVRSKCTTEAPPIVGEGALILHGTGGDTLPALRRSARELLKPRTQSATSEVAKYSRGDILIVAVPRGGEFAVDALAFK